MKFTDYESSHITTQMTLLKKFNEVLKFLREINPSTDKIKFYIHEINYQYMGTRTLFLMSTSNIDLSEAILESEKVPEILFIVSPFSFNVRLDLTSSDGKYYVKIHDIQNNTNHSITNDTIEEI